MWFENKLQVNIITDNNEEILNFRTFHRQTFFWFIIIIRSSMWKFQSSFELIWLKRASSCFGYFHFNNWRSLLTRNVLNDACYFCFCESMRMKIMVLTSYPWNLPCLKFWKLPWLFLKDVFGALLCWKFCLWPKFWEVSLAPLGTP